MRSTTAAFQTLLANPEASPDLQQLLTIKADAGTIRRAKWNADVTFNALTYTADDFHFSEVSQNLEGRRNRIELSIQNVKHPTTEAERPWSTYLATNDLNGTEVELRIVAVSTIADTSAVIQELRWEISGWSIDGGFVRFGLGSPHDALTFVTPTQPLGARTCGWDYKKGPCRSVSSREKCNKTVLDCTARFPVGGIIDFGPSFPFFTQTTRGRS